MKRLYIIIMVLAMITVNSYAQSLSVANIEAQTGEETELVVSLMEGASMTALQFNLALPFVCTLQYGPQSVQGWRIASHSCENG